MPRPAAVRAGQHTATAAVSRPSASRPFGLLRPPLPALPPITQVTTVLGQEFGGATKREQRKDARRT
ncbi:hypothetical protein SBD_6412 [Streptomyces bottropensis ATCC 25435]|uniref:Uncharacterized protein n=1 Tax=Streptomyces bottropensis ATCC 25435 TaxID=1054862 RepID=M3FG68_9ACTN|nr:hypothetical protein SBD_6412 [Streptomyces bottropensis ATCC 25435]